MPEGDLSAFKGMKAPDTWLGKNYRRFKLLEEPPKPPKPPRGRKAVSLVEWPRCQHGTTPPRDCERCHPPLEALQALDWFDGTGKPRPGPLWSPTPPEQTSQDARHASERGEVVHGCVCKSCPSQKGGPCRCGRFWWDDHRRPRCGMHDPNPKGDPTRPARMRWKD